MKNDTTKFTPKFKGMKEKDISKIKYRDYHICGYNEKGYEIYFEDSEGFWGKWEYDEEGHGIYSANSKGHWTKCEYDEKGKMIYSENNHGEWEKREHDEKGKVISRTEGRKLLTKKT